MMNNNISECNNNITHTYISSNTTVNNMNNTVSNVGCGGRWSPKEKEPPRTRSSDEIPEKPSSPPCPGVQRHQVATDVLVLLPDTSAYNPLAGRLPLHRLGPTRPPPKKIQVDDR